MKMIKSCGSKNDCPSCWDHPTQSLGGYQMLCAWHGDGCAFEDYSPAAYGGGMYPPPSSMGLAALPPGSTIKSPPPPYPPLPSSYPPMMMYPPRGPPPFPPSYGGRRLNADYGSSWLSHDTNFNGYGNNGDYGGGACYLHGISGGFHPVGELNNKLIAAIVTSCLNAAIHIGMITYGLVKGKMNSKITASSW